MEAQYKTWSGRLLVKIQAEDVKTLVRELSAVQEVFDADTACGCCNSTDIRYRVREVDGNEYYELNCLNCGASFAFGQHKKSKTLFPKRQAADGTKLPNRGWAKWSPNGNATTNGNVPVQTGDSRADNSRSK